MQPYLFPYLGYIGLIKHTDEFILFDTVQFIRHGWIERNRILKQGEGWLYIKAPIVKESRDTLIKDVLINNKEDWKGKLLAQLQPYKKIAPYYKDVIQVVQKIFERDYETIVELNHAALEEVCSYLGIESDIKIFSKMDLAIEPANAPDEWALNICRALGDINEYWNPPGGQEFFDHKKYDAAGIKLVFHKPLLSSYDQKREPFEPGLSILDVLMFNSPEKVNEMLDAYELL
jgi:hypothetical protein